MSGSRIASEGRKEVGWGDIISSYGKVEALSIRRAKPREQGDNYITLAGSFMPVSPLLGKFHLQPLFSKTILSAQS